MPRTAAPKSPAILAVDTLAALEAAATKHEAVAAQIRKAIKLVKATQKALTPPVTV